MRLLTLLGIFILPLVADDNVWRFQNTIKLSEGSITIVCSASGDDIDFARSKAIEKCKRSAADHLVKTHNFLVVEQKLGSEYRSLKRLSKNAQLDGLSCEPQKDFYEDDKYWVKCFFKRPSVKNITMNTPPNTDFSKESVITQLAIRPSCTNVYVLTKDVDIYPCDGSFVNIERPTNRTLIVVASKKYMSKKYTLKNQEGFYETQKIDLWD